MLVPVPHLLLIQTFHSIGQDFLFTSESWRGVLSFNGSESGPTQALTKFNSGQSSCFCCPQVSSYLCLRISAIIQLLLPETWEPAYTPFSTVIIKPIDSITRIHLLCFLPSSKSVTPPPPPPDSRTISPQNIRSHLKPQVCRSAQALVSWGAVRTVEGAQ